MRVDSGEVEFADDEEEHGSRGYESGMPACFAFSGLKQAVDCFEEAIGLAGLRPGDDAVEVIADHACNLLYRRDFGAHDVDEPLTQHGGDDVDLLAAQDLVQVFLVEPGTRGALSGGVGAQRVQIGALSGRQALAILEQRPARTFQIGVGFLLHATGLIDLGGGMADDVERIEGDASVRQMLGYAFDERGPHVHAHRCDLPGVGLVCLQVLAERCNGLGVVVRGDENDFALDRIGNHRQILVAAFARGFVDRHGGGLGQIGGGYRQLDIARTDRVYAMPAFAHQARHRGKRHLLGTSPEPKLQAAE